MHKCIKTSVQNSTADSGPQAPEFIRLPKPGSRCPYTGLNRSTLSELTLPCDANGFSAPVKSVLLRKRGATRGIRLISFDSLIGYLNGLAGKEVPDDPSSN